MNHRQYLLAAVEAFLIASPESLQHAHGLIDGWRKLSTGGTLAWLIWGHYFSELSDSLFYENREYLEETSQELQGLRKILHRMYIRRDYQSEFTRDERKLFEKTKALLDMREWLYTVDPLQAAPILESTQKAITEIMVGFPSQGEEESLHLHLLKEVGETVRTISGGERVMQMYRYPVPDGPYSQIQPYSPSHEPPDLSEVLNRMSNALEVLQGTRMLYATWSILSTDVLCSFHY